MTFPPSPRSVAPEGLAAFTARGKNYVAVANQVSDSTSLFEITVRSVGSASRP